MNDELSITMGPTDAYGRRKVVAKLGSKAHPHTFNPFDQGQRRFFREAVISKFDLPDDAHEHLEKRILSAAETAEPLIECSTVKLSDVEPEQVEWLWRERIAIGKLTLIVGDPGEGKSFLTLAIAAAVSRGAPWPDAPKERQPAGDAIILTAEDDLADTVRPRLDAHEADVERIIAIRGAKFIDDSEERMVNLATDLDSIRRVIQSANEPRAIIIDPVSAYLGKTDSHKNAEVRGVLAPLSELAAETRVAVIAVSHLRKGEGAALYRTMGSLAFIAAARSAWVVCRDPNDPKRKRRLMLPLKSNIAPDVGGLAFSIMAHGFDSQPSLCWEAGPVADAADDVIGHKRRRGPEPTERDEAAGWLRERLAEGPRPAADVLDDGKACGYSRRTLYRAFDEIGGTSKISGFPARARWSLASCTNGAQHKQTGIPGMTGTANQNTEQQQHSSKFLSKERVVVPDCESVEQLDGFDVDGANNDEPW